MLYENLTVLKKKLRELDSVSGQAVQAIRQIEGANRAFESSGVTEAQKAEAIASLNLPGIKAVYDEALAIYQAAEILPDPDENQGAP